MNAWLNTGASSAVDIRPSGVVLNLSFLMAQRGHEAARMLAMAHPERMSLVLSTLATIMSLP